MAEQQVIRIHMQDRPGALSQVCLALASHGVNIVHLDVVSTGEDGVVDDLVLEGKQPGDIARAVRSFLADVTVAPLPGITEEPLVAFGTAIARMGGSGDVNTALDEMARGAGSFLRADKAVMLRLKPGSGRFISPLAGVPDIEAGEEFAGRAAFEPAVAAAFPGDCEWAPAGFRGAMAGAQVAIAPAASLGLVVLSRHANIPFAAGELKRLALYASAGAGILARLSEGGGVAPAAGDRLPAMARVEPLPMP